MNTDFWKTFNTKVPQKQPKIYEIDLGQTVSIILLFSNRMDLTKRNFC